MFKRIVKRDGKIVKFDPEKITNAIAKAGLATEEFKYDRAKALCEKVLKRAEETILHLLPKTSWPAGAIWSSSSSHFPSSLWCFWNS